MTKIVFLVLAAALLTACGTPGAPAAPAEVTVVKASPTPAATKSKAGVPAVITIPKLNVKARLVELGLTGSGAMETPSFGLAGWYGLGPRPGEPGPAVIAAHVDSKSGPDVFARLHTLKRGDDVIVADAKGRVRAFEVERSERVAKTALPTRKIWGKTSEPALRLITCGGAFDRATGHYTDNVIVYASAD